MTNTIKLNILSVIHLDNNLIKIIKLKIKGEWKDDMANGFGVYLHFDGLKYEGYWENDMQEGYGIETWQNGAKYEGNFSKAKKNGKG